MARPASTRLLGLLALVALASAVHTESEDPHKLEGLPAGDTKARVLRAATGAASGVGHMALSTAKLAGKAVKEVASAFKDRKEAIAEFKKPLNPEPVIEAPNVSFGERWDLSGALEDKPAGAYMRLMHPVTEAVSLSYWATSGPDSHAYGPKSTLYAEVSGGQGTWKRVNDLERDPHQSGIHALVFHNEPIGRVIVAFRGSCMDKSMRQCRADSCVLSRFNSFGRVSAKLWGSKECPEMKHEDLDYLDQAHDLVTRVQERFPGHALLLVGHSMGGLLATVTAARHAASGGAGSVQAFSVAPSPYINALRDDLKLSEEQIKALPRNDLVAVCDQYDCAVNTEMVPEARLGATTCLFKSWDKKHWEPKSCRFVKRMLKDDGHFSGVREVPMALKCKQATHQWDRYAWLLHWHETRPTCSDQYSVLPGIVEGL